MTADIGAWTSAAAVGWVIDDAPVPADLAFTLVVIARRAGSDGRGSYQSIATIARLTGKSVTQAERDVARLRKLGLLLLGDQTQVAHLPGGQRPVVYDLPLHRAGPKPAKVSRNKSGAKKDPDPSTPGMDAGGGDAGTPRMDAGSTPRMDAGQTNPMNNPLKNPSPQPPEPPGPAAADGEPDPEEGEAETSDQETKIRTLVADVAGHRPAWSTRRIDRAIRTCLADGRAWDAIARAAPLVAADPTTEAPGRLVHDGPWWHAPPPADDAPGRPETPPWCGRCESPEWRFNEADDDQGRPYRCPDCHPAASARPGRPTPTPDDDAPVLRRLTAITAAA